MSSVQAQCREAASNGSNTSTMGEQLYAGLKCSRGGGTWASGYKVCSDTSKLASRSNCIIFASWLRPASCKQAGACKHTITCLCCV